MTESIQASSNLQRPFWERAPLVALGLILSGALLLSAFIGANTAYRIKQLSQSQLSVTGYAVQPVTSDQVKWNLRVEARGESRSDAYQNLTQQYNQVKTYLTKNGLDTKELTDQPLQSNAMYQSSGNGYNTNVIVGFEMSKTLTVETGKVATVQKLAQSTETLLEQGVGLQPEAPQYQFSKLEDMKVEMLARAMQNAKTRAQRMAKSTDNNVGPLISASSGVFQITPVGSTEVADWGVNDTSTVKKDVRAVVNATFGVE